MLVACGDDGSSNSVSNSDEDSSSSVCEDCDGSSSSKAKASSSSSVTPKSSERETSVSSSSAKSSSSSKDVILGSSEGSSPSSSSSEQAEGTLTDSRDGQTYKTVKIGSQTWMAENLNYAYTDVPYNFDGYTSDSISWCYDNDPANCTKYGRLYTWAAAMDSVGSWSANGKGCGFYGSICSPTGTVRGVCPEGWHLPTQTEWYTLFTAVGGSSTAGKMLKSTSGWNSSGNGTDAYSFSALPAGGSYYNGSSGGEGNYANFWSSTEYGSYDAYNIRLDYDDVYANLFYDYKTFEFSVRCVKD
ncbi:MAG: fibrobacter succinogenes major paralogous domain-containing protein [Fibrobacter sp.]|nr:fibrobacter succinogenes major paralogous domain-containing protein [Fibrobacter sp.]